MQPSTSSDPQPAPSKQTAIQPARQKERYRLGIIGSKESGKTCLITSLTMERVPNPQNLTANLMAPDPEEDAAYQEGRASINKATIAFRSDPGEWPEATPNDDKDKAFLFSFGDGGTRQKLVEVFDYSGELLDPMLSTDERASKLRDLLRQMDGLLVIAEHPLSAQDTSIVGKKLSGLMQSFTLLLDGKGRKRKKTQVPIALIVSKWDRSEYFVKPGDAVQQTRLLVEKYLKSTPPPYHAAVANTLRPAAFDYFGIFAVSAMGPLERTGDKEQPPREPLCSMGLEEPFLWIIRQVDEIALASLKSRLSTKWNWVIPWPVERREINRLKARIGKDTPERSALNGLSRKSWLLFACGLFIWLGIAPAIYDKWQHHRAEIAIKDPQGDWHEGTKWLRIYADSSPINHILYKRLFSASEAAARVQQVTEQKDDAAFASIPKLSADKPGSLDEAEKLAREQLTHFPNSSHSDERKRVLEQVSRFRHELAFEKELSQWRQEHDKILSNRITSVREKLKEISSMEKNISQSAAVPLDGPLREEWSALLQKMLLARKQLGEEITIVEKLDKIDKAFVTDDYLEAIDLLADWSDKHDAVIKQRLKKLQSSVATKVEESTRVMSQQGAKWSDAVNEAEQFLQPGRRALLTGSNVKAIERIIQNLKMKGDEHFYESAREISDTATLNAYLNDAPLKSMADEVIQYRNWLNERVKRREITFRLTEIDWEGIPEKGRTEDTKIKLYVNGIGDDRNQKEGNDPRTGVSSNKDGIRSVILENVKQIDDVRVRFQVWNNWFRDKKLISKEILLSPEKLLDQPTHTDDSGTKFTIKAEGVLPKPDLPAWRVKP